MGDLIDRDTLLEKFQDEKVYNVSPLHLMLIEDAPAVDAAPVRRGQWIKYDGYTECSECEYWYNSPECEDSSDRHAYCPNCRVKMDREVG